MKRFYRYCVSFLLVFITVPVFAFQWPVDDLVITATFGESRWNHFHSGIDIGGGEQIISSTEQGELLYYYEEHEIPGDIPTGLGNFAAVLHGTSMLSLYCHMKKGSMDPSVTSLDVDTPLGIIGDTGSSYGKHLHLSIYDLELEKVVNPMLVLPSLADSTPPVIESIALGKETNVYNLHEGVQLFPGKYDVLIKSYDPSHYVSYFCPMAPYRQTVILNGESVRDIKYDSLKISDKGNIKLQSADTKFSDFYVEDWITNVGTIILTAGENRVEVLVEDFAGNQSTRKFTIIVSSD